MPFAFVDILTDNLGEWSSGFWMTVRIVVFSFLIAMAVGTLIGAFRVAPNKILNGIGGVYVEFFRNIPLLILCYILFFGLREEDGPNIGITGLVAGILALGLYTAAYIAEALRSGVFSVSKGQIEASLSLGLTYQETMRRIILPQAFRTVISPIGSLIIAMIKNSAVLGVAVALTDLLKTGRVLSSRTFETEASFFWAAVGYLILTGLVTVAIRVLENRYAIKR